MAAKTSNVQIVVLQRGWVFVGDFSQEGSECLIKNGYNVRRWATTTGLGELAEKGPLENTKLDPVADVTFHELAVVAKIKCAKPWADKCKAR